MGKVAKMSTLKADILADELENWYPTINLCVHSANMLRQLQAENEALKAHPVKEPNYKFGVDWGKDDKSVTVVKICEDGVAEIVFVDYQERPHPVKELTDEEIDDIGREHLTDGDGAIEFAKAILRKAQEK